MKLTHQARIGGLMIAAALIVAACGGSTTSGEPASEKTVAKLGHGGILTRSQRFRFPPYARELDAPDG